MHISPPCRQNIQGYILAGGRATRMQGEDKGLLELNGKPLVAHVIDLLRPQVASLCICANRHIKQYQRYGLPVITDNLTGYLGPLAGVHAAMLSCEKEWLLIVPVDCPFLATDLVQRLSQAVMDEERPLSVVHDGSALQPTFCLLHQSLADSLEQYLQQGGRKTGQWLQQNNPAMADFSDKPEAFLNINSRAELLQAEEQLAHVDE